VLICLCNVIGKVYKHIVNVHEGVEVKFHEFLTSELYVCGAQLDVSVALPSGEKDLDSYWR
jgi:hypothetical protein